MNSKNYLLSLLAALAFMSCGGGISGTVDETDTEVFATIVDSSDAPAAGVSVRLFRTGDTTKQFLDSARTGTDGTYRFSRVAKGDYTLWAERDNQAVYKQQLTLGDAGYKGRDTLAATRTVAIPVGVQPLDDPRNIEVQILGTHLFSNVTSESFVTFENLPVGLYSLRAVPYNLEGYTPTSKSYLVDANSPDTLSDTLEMIYTGVPVVKGVTVDYNKASGAVELHWARTSYSEKFFNTYCIYREPIEVEPLSTEKIADTPDTTFSENLKGVSLEAGQYVYRVVIRNNKNEKGYPGCDTISFYPPLASLDLLEPTTAQASLGQALALPLSLPTWVEAPEISWQLGAESGSSTRRDSLVITPREQFGTLPLTVTITAGGETVQEQLSVSIAATWQEAPAHGIGGALREPTTHGNEQWLSSDGGDVLQLYRGGGTSWQLVSEARFTKATSRASNLVSFDGALHIVDSAGILRRSTDGMSWSSLTADPAVDPLRGIYEQRHLRNIGGELILFTENSQHLDQERPSVQLYGWRYDAASKSWVALAEPKLLLEPHRYWLVQSESGLTAYELHFRRRSKSLLAYHFTGDGFSEPDTVASDLPVEALPWAESPYQCSATLRNGQLLAMGATSGDLLLLPAQKEITTVAAAGAPCFVTTAGQLLRLSEGKSDAIAFQ